ncbi:MAG: 3-deoxy-D-manno-octulosonic acid transferase [Chromatiales bacterium]|nr:3-deoxy-D-manno-octulosonic acid transferase [Chromatiales bacterium]
MATAQPSPRLTLLLYRTLLWLLTPYLRWRFTREGKHFNDPHFARQRCGSHHPEFRDGTLWLHAASVGEVNALLPLIEALHTEHPELPLLLTSNTASSGAVARERLPAGVTHAYLPFDWPAAMHRFLAHVRPRVGVIMETELWPNLYGQCAHEGVPLLIINGRISQKTLGAPRWLKPLYRGCLQQTTQVLARSELDRERFLRLGANPATTRVIGNIKVAALNRTSPPPIELGREYLLAASTRDGEERLVVEAWQQSGREELLVIAPRHIQRLETILTELAPFGLNVAVRSRGDAIGDETQLYIADTFGELGGFIAGARLVFMGGSLVAMGGHNILEPAAMGKAVVTGPHMENFLDESRVLREGGGLLQVASVGELATTLAQLLGEPASCDTLGERAREVMAKQADVVERYLEALNPYL